MAAVKNITMVRGDTLAFGMEFEGLEQDLASAYFTCESNTTEDANIFQKSLGNGISKVSTGKYRVRVAPADTAEADIGFYNYSLKIGVNSDVFTILKGVLEIEDDVT